MMSVEEFQDWGWRISTNDETCQLRDFRIGVGGFSTMGQRFTHQGIGTEVSRVMHESGCRQGLGVGV
jgi:hypothetical protein